MLCEQDKKDFISCELLVNSTPIIGIVDTGARVSVVSLELAQRHQWPLIAGEFRISGPSGERLE